MSSSKTDVADAEEESEPRHPLLDYKPRVLRSWVDWLAAWENTQDALLRQSLLHYGYDVRVESRDEDFERDKFFMAVADGHAQYAHDFFELPDDTRLMWHNITWPDGTKTDGPRDVRKKLAEEAFRVFSRNFFKPVQRDVDPYETQLRILDGNPQRLPLLARLFRCKDGLGRDFVNLDFDDNSNDKAMRDAVAFAEWLAEMAFSRRVEEIRRVGADGYRQSMSHEFVQTLVQLQAGLLPILRPHKKLGVLRSFEGDLGDESPVMLALRHMALGEKLWFDLHASKSRLPTTIDEAIYGGSYPATVIKLIEIYRVEAARLNAIREPIEIGRQPKGG